MKTAASVTPMPTSAGVISFMDLRVASLGDRPSSLITRSTFSTTTMASSTSRPMASTIANMVSMLMEYPSADNTPNVPSSTTGTAMAGIMVARKFCKKIYITITTSSMASASVLTTSVIEARTNGVESELMTPVMPSGKKGASSPILRAIESATFIALAPSASTMPMPAPGRPFKRDLMVRLSASRATRATSAMVTTEPSVPDFSTMLSNSSTV